MGSNPNRRYAKLHVLLLYSLLFFFVITSITKIFLSSKYSLNTRNSLKKLRSAHFISEPLKPHTSKIISLKMYVVSSAIWPIRFRCVFTFLLLVEKKSSSFAWLAVLRTRKTFETSWAILFAVIFCVSFSPDHLIKRKSFTFSSFEFDWDLLVDGFACERRNHFFVFNWKVVFPLQRSCKSRWVAVMWVE